MCKKVDVRLNRLTADEITKWTSGYYKSPNNEKKQIKKVNTSNLETCIDGTIVIEILDSEDDLVTISPKPKVTMSSIGMPVHSTSFATTKNLSHNCNPRINGQENAFTDSNHNFMNDHMYSKPSISCLHPSESVNEILGSAIQNRSPRKRSGELSLKISPLKETSCNAFDFATKNGVNMPNSSDNTKSSKSHKSMESDSDSDIEFLGCVTNNSRLHSSSSSPTSNFNRSSMPSVITKNRSTLDNGVRKRRSSVLQERSSLDSLLSNVQTGSPTEVCAASGYSLKDYSEKANNPSYPLQQSTLLYNPSSKRSVVDVHNDDSLSVTSCNNSSDHLDDHFSAKMRPKRICSLRNVKSSLEIITPMNPRGSSNEFSCVESSVTELIKRAMNKASLLLLTENNLSCVFQCHVCGFSQMYSRNISMNIAWHLCKFHKELPSTMISHVEQMNSLPVAYIQVVPVE